MPKFVIEREIPGVGDWTPEQLQAASQTSCNVLNKLGPQIQWLESYVTGDKTYCVYIAPNEEVVREHAKLGGFPANRISAVRTMIDPTRLYLFILAARSDRAMQHYKRVGNPKHAVGGDHCCPTLLDS